jgi:zinc D-Ala-D-Ala carboxypeptidase
MARHFTDAEIVGLQPKLVEMLDNARDVAGIPFIITSGLRTMDANALAGGAHNSSHLRGLAVDLAVGGDMDRFLITKALLAAGFNRVGLYVSHVHGDCDDSLPPNVLWTKDTD